MLKWISLVLVTPALAFSQSAIDFDTYQDSLGITGDATCLDHILHHRDPSLEYRIQFHGRTYDFEDLIQVLDFEGKVVFEGEPGTLFRVHSGGLEVHSALTKEVLDRPLRRGQVPNDLLRPDGHFAAVKVDSRDTVENAWGYVANDLISFRSAADGAQVVIDTLHFDYRPFDAILTYYRPAYVEFRNIAFQSEVPGHPWLILTGAKAKFEDCSFAFTGSQTLHIIVRLNDCHDVMVSRVRVSGNVTYGFLINGCRNVQFSDVNSRDCFYPIVPANFSTGVHTERFFGLGSVIDAHPSFDVRYKDVTIEDGQYYFNCRALGVVLENCIFRVRPGIHDNSIYLGVLNLREPYTFLAAEYDVICRNVKWSYTDQEFNGLHVHQCRDFFVENCETHAVSTGMPIRHYIVRDSRVGRIYAADANVTIEHTRFSPEYQTAEYPRPPLYANYSGLMKLESCEFSGFSETALFEYIHDPRTEVRLVNTRMEGITHFADRSWAVTSSYDRVTFDKCRMNDGLDIRFSDNPSIIVKK